MSAWTPEQIAEMRRLAAENHSAGQIGFAIGKPRGSVCVKARALGIKLNGAHWRGGAHASKGGIVRSRPAPPATVHAERHVLTFGAPSKAPPPLPPPASPTPEDAAIRALLASCDRKRCVAPVNREVA